jgi:hypothetical protein
LPTKQSDSALRNLLALMYLSPSLIDSLCQPLGAIHFDP